MRAVRISLVLAALACISISAVWLLPRMAFACGWCDRVSASTELRIRRGMTKDEVMAIIGRRPDRIDDRHLTWQHSRRLAFLDVWFNGEAVERTLFLDFEIREQPIGRWEQFLRWLES